MTIITREPPKGELGSVVFVAARSASSSRLSRTVLMNVVLATLRPGLALLLLSIASSTGEREMEWQYFCFRSAEKFGRISTSKLFSVLPSPGDEVDRILERQSTAASELEEAPVAEEEEELTQEEADDEDIDPAGAPALMKSLRGICYFSRIDYWTYEVCPSQRVRQYHSESGGGTSQAVHSEFSLGAHDPTQDSWSEPQQQQAATGATRSSRRRASSEASSRAYVQAFMGGTDGRSTRVRYVCPDSKRDEDGIVTVTEQQPKT